MQTSDCANLRRLLKQIAEDVLRLRDDGDAPSEAIANVMLAYRHLEDASMRIGKAMQALDGGASVYDRTQVPGA
jgi:hypothetical protein